MPANRNDGEDGAVWLPPEGSPEERDPSQADVSHGSRPPHAGAGDQAIPQQAVLEMLWRAQADRAKRRRWLHLVLFLATIASTSYFVTPRYSACLMAILTAHEFGHYFAARRHLVPASLPYFIPAPFIFGTMGAFIRMSPLVPNRRALFDIAAAGPIAGVVLAIPISFVGVMTSERVVMGEDTPGVILGDPLMFRLFEWFSFGPSQEGMVLMLNDIGFAGWVGLFVTGLNLLPIGQLDGGHISHAAFGAKSVLVARATFIILAVICAVYAFQYLVLIVLLFFMGLRHPPTLDDATPLDPTRARVAIAVAGLFVLCFVPVPMEINI